MPQHGKAAPVKRRLREMRRFVPAIVWMGVIYALSDRSGGQLNEWLPWFREWLPGFKSFDPMHYAAYFVLALTVAYAQGPLALTWKGCLWNWLVCVLYGMTDEWHQAYVPNRSPDWLDLRNDAIGAAAACLVLRIAGKAEKGKGTRNYSQGSSRNLQ